MTPEQIKLYHETYKHLTTLSAGGIVLVSALFRADDYPTRFGGLLVVSCLVVSTVISILIMFLLAGGDISQKITVWGSRAVIFLWGVASGSLAVLGLSRS